MRISSVERLRDQGSNGSPAYEFTTKIAVIKQARPMVCNFFNSVTHWCNPSKAPPKANWTRRKSARLSITKGAGDAMISYPNINEIENVLYKIGTNSQAA